MGSYSTYLKLKQDDAGLVSLERIMFTTVKSQRKQHEDTSKEFCILIVGYMSFEAIFQPLLAQILEHEFYNSTPQLERWLGTNRFIF